MLDQIVDSVFELGKIIRKIELSKDESARIIQTLGGNEAETILFQKLGKYWNQQSFFDRPDGLIVVTNYRLVFLAKVKTILTKSDFFSFPLEFIKDVDITRVMLMSPAIKFNFEGKIYKFTFFSNPTDVRDAVRKAKGIV